MSKLDTFKASVLNYIHHFSAYDYAAYAWLIILFFVSILLAIIVARKNSTLSVIIVLLSLILLFAGPFVLKHYLDQYLRQASSNVIDIKKLTFSNTLIIKGSITNMSRHNFSTCSIYIDVLKNSENQLKNYIYKLKPLIKKTIYINKTIEINSSEEFSVVFDNYTYTKDVNVSINSVCY